MVVAGLVGSAVGMGIAAWRSMRWTLGGRHELGLVAVAVAALVCFAAALLLGGPPALGLPAAATVAGLALAFRGGDPSQPSDEDPPWWPSFERDLRRYERSRRSPVR